MMNQQKLLWVILGLVALLSIAVVVQQLPHAELNTQVGLPSRPAPQSLCQQLSLLCAQQKNLNGQAAEILAQYNQRQTLGEPPVCLTMKSLCSTAVTPTPTPTHTLPPPPPLETPANCRPQGSCRGNQMCALGFICSGLPAYGCYPPGCPYPICLSAEAMIDTPDGAINVQLLKIGMLVWTQNVQGQKIAVPVLQTARTPVPATHQMIKLILSDGRQLEVSAPHPLSNGQAVSSLKVGDWYDATRVTSVMLVPYHESATYDLLPAGATGRYWANGILLNSTLAGR